MDQSVYNLMETSVWFSLGLVRYLNIQVLFSIIKSVKFRKEDFDLNHARFQSLSSPGNGKIWYIGEGRRDLKCFMKAIPTIFFLPSSKNNCHCSELCLPVPRLDDAVCWLSLHVEDCITNKSKKEIILSDKFLSDSATQYNQSCIKLSLW